MPHFGRIKMLENSLVYLLFTSVQRSLRFYTFFSFFLHFMRRWSFCVCYAKRRLSRFVFASLSSVVSNYHENERIRRKRMIAVWSKLLSSFIINLSSFGVRETFKQTPTSPQISASFEMRSWSPLTLKFSLSVRQSVEISAGLTSHARALN